MASQTIASSGTQRPTFGTITRARGKCFIRLGGVRDEEALRCRATGAGGQDLPGRVTRTERGDVVLVVPVVPFDVRVELYSVGSSYPMTLVASKLIRHHIAALASKLNAVTGNHAARAMRSSDALLIEDGLSFDLLARDGATEVLRGKVMIARPQGDPLLAREVEVVALDALSGRAISDGWVSLGDSAPLRKNYPGICERVVDYSLRVPADSRGLVVWARWTDDHTTIGFSVLFDEWRESLRDDWGRRTRYADRDPAYEAWFLEKHRVSPCELELQRLAWETLLERPLFSIIVPLFRTPLDFLAEMAESILAQSYPNFELILVNASPEEADLAAAVESLSNRDARVREVRLASNLGITENTNAGIRVASGDFLVFVDHDDTIEPDALYRYAMAVNERPSTDLIYCDEDHLRDGHLLLPFFKPDWDIDLLRRENYVCHMLAVRRDIVMSLNNLPGREFDGSQDHNMTLVVGERARDIAHVNKVLYHWRMHDQSVAGAGIEQKSYALEAERLAVQNHLDRVGERARAVMGARVATRCDIVHEFARHPLVSIVIPSHDGASVLGRCLDSIFTKLTWPNYEVVVVENGSLEQETFALYAEACASHDNVRVVTCDLERGFNFSRLVNCGAREASGEYLLLLNNDTEVISPDALELMMGHALREDVGCVGAKLLYPDGLVQHGGVTVGRSFGPMHFGFLLPDAEPGYYERMVLPHQLSAVTAACMLIRRDVYEKVGGFDESLPVDYNDIDFCLKVRSAGLAVVEQTDAKFYHYESVSRGLEKTPGQFRELVRAQGVYASRWGDFLAFGDPFHGSHFAFDDMYCKLEDNDLPLGATSLADFV